MTRADPSPECEVCGRSGKDAARCTFGNRRGLCTCWRGTPCSGKVNAPDYLHARKDAAR